MIKVGTWGSFDYIIHAGHIALLNEAKALGDYLIVFVVPDSVIKNNKHRIPFYSQQRRSANLLLTGIVDETINLLDSGYIDNVDNQIIPLSLDKWVFGRDQLTEADDYLKQELMNNRTQIIISKSPEIICTSELLSNIGYI